MDKLDATDRDSRRDAGAVLETGLLIQRAALGSEATYRIVGENDRGVEVEVVEAPGLQPNTRFTFTTADVIEMTAPEGHRAKHPRRAHRKTLIAEARTVS